MLKTKLNPLLLGEKYLMIWFKKISYIFYYLCDYIPFHNYLPFSSVHVNSQTVRNYETGFIIHSLFVHLRFRSIALLSYYKITIRICTTKLTIFFHSSRMNMGIFIYFLYFKKILLSPSPKCMSDYQYINKWDLS